jgi:hypothetical protein
MTLHELCKALADALELVGADPVLDAIEGLVGAYNTSRDPSELAARDALVRLLVDFQNRKP